MSSKPIFGDPSSIEKLSRKDQEHVRIINETIEFLKEHLDISYVDPKIYKVPESQLRPQPRKLL